MVRLSEHPDLSEAERAALRAGRHAEVAEALRARGRPDLAGRVYESLWDFPAAVDAYLAADDPRAAVEAALAADDPSLLGRAIEAAATLPAERLRPVTESLRRAGRAADAARLSAAAGDPRAEIDAMIEAGDPLAAARRALEAGLDAEALGALGPLLSRDDLAALALAARARWNLGDVEGAVRAAQRALRAGCQDDDLRAQLAAGLAVLGYATAARVVAPAAALDLPRAPPRFRVLAPMKARFCGVAFLALDRVTLEEVEVHWLLGEVAAGDLRAAELVTAALQDARAGQALAHPAVTPVRFEDVRAGLLVLPHAAPSGLGGGARALSSRLLCAHFAFLARGLAAGHAAGLVSGGVFPSLWTSDAAGRPRLPPFGVHHLHALAGTRTAGLEEVLALSAPEVRAGGPWTAAADVYGLARAFVALWLGAYDRPDVDALSWDPELAEVLAAALADEPDRRPPAADLARVFAQSRCTPARLAGPGRGEMAAPVRGAGPPRRILWVEAADAWTPDELEALAQAEVPWFQPILDRNGRAFGLAPWPPGSAVLANAGGEAPLQTIPALADLPPRVADPIRTRLGPRSFVRAPGGAVLVALDDVLTR